MLLRVETVFLKGGDYDLSAPLQVETAEAAPLAPDLL